MSLRILDPWRGRHYVPLTHLEPITDPAVTLHHVSEGKPE